MSLTSHAQQGNSWPRHITLDPRASMNPQTTPIHNRNYRFGFLTAFKRPCGLQALFCLEQCFFKVGQTAFKSSLRDISAWALTKVWCSHGKIKCVMLWDPQSPAFDLTQAWTAKQLKRNSSALKRYQGYAFRSFNFWGKWIFFKCTSFHPLYKSEQDNFDCMRKEPPILSCPLALLIFELERGCFTPSPSPTMARVTHTHHPGGQLPCVSFRWLQHPIYIAPMHLHSAREDRKQKERL